MFDIAVHHNNEIDSDRSKAIATARLVKCAAMDASDLGLKECTQLLYFVVDIIKIKYKLNKEETLMEFVGEV